MNLGPGRCPSASLEHTHTMALKQVLWLSPGAGREAQCFLRIGSRHTFSKKTGVMAHTCHPSIWGDQAAGMSNEILFQKTKPQTRSQELLRMQLRGKALTSLAVLGRGFYLQHYKAPSPQNKLLNPSQEKP